LLLFALRCFALLSSRLVTREPQGTRLGGFPGEPGPAAPRSNTPIALERNKNP